MRGLLKKLRLPPLLILLIGLPCFGKPLSPACIFSTIEDRLADAGATINLRQNLPSARRASENGGFAQGVTEAEVIQINRSFGGITQINGHVSSIFTAADHQSGFLRKSAAVIRAIAGAHLFDNGNKRTAQTVYELLRERNNIISGVDTDRVRRIIDRIGRGELREVDAIARELRGF